MLFLQTTKWKWYYGVLCIILYYGVVLCLHRFFWATRFLIFIFSLFFVFGPCARLSWPSRQLLSARKSISYRIVSYWIASFLMTLWPLRSFSYCESFYMRFFINLCSSWQHFNWYCMSGGLSAVADLAVFPLFSDIFLLKVEMCIYVYRARCLTCHHWS